jgi:flagellar biosynthesis/type III secretory pathway protein FliH
LGDYVRDEEDANNDFRNGWEPGTTKARRLKQEQDSAAWKRRYEDFIKDGWPATVASYLASGYSIKEAQEKGKPKTAEQEAADTKKWEKYWDRQQKKAETAAKKFDAAGYHKGRELGETISLNQQLDKVNQGALK